MRTLRFGLIGCGSVARKHAEALKRIEGVVLAGVSDKNPSAAEKFAAEYRTAAYADYREMLKRESVDVAVVLTPSGDHGDRILDLVSRVKHIVVEKPMALRLEEADRVVRECDAQGVRLFVVKQNRYNKPVTALRKALDAGRFGKLVLGTVRVRWTRPQSYYSSSPWRGTWAEDGGVVANQASHHVDMLEWMMGEPESIMAMTARRLANIEAEDTATALIRFRSGALGVIEATTATRPKDLEGSLSILGETGSVVIGGFSMDRLSTWQFSEPKPEDERIFETDGSNPDAFAWNHTEYLRNVVQSIGQGTRALVDGLEGRKSLELITALYESVETGKEVSLRFRPQRCRLGMRTDG